MIPVFLCVTMYSWNKAPFNWRGFEKSCSIKLKKKKKGGETCNLPTWASSFRFLYFLYSVPTTIPAWKAVLSMCLYIDKVIPTYLPLKAIQNADRCHIVKIIKIIKTFQLLNIYPTPSTARHFTCFQSSQSSYQDIIIPSSQLQKQTQKKKEKEKRKLPKTIKLSPLRSTWVQIPPSSHYSSGSRSKSEIFNCRSQPLSGSWK